MEDQQNTYNGNQGDEDARKLFIGGLPSSANKNDLEEYFGKFGEVEMCTIKTDVQSGRSRGFGFLIFKTADAVNGVLAVSHHEIHDKKIDPKLATPQGGDSGSKSTKIFVGGLEKTVTKEEITSAFSQRGNVVDVYLPIERETGAPKGFAFVNFDDSDIVQTLLNEGKITIGSSECDIKTANNKNDTQRGRGGFRGGRGGFNRGRGGYGGNYGSYDNGYGGGYEQYGGYGGGYQGGYGSSYGGGYGQYGGGYDQGSYGGYGGGYGYDQQYGGESGYGSQDQYKMKGGRGRGGSFQPY